MEIGITAIIIIVLVVWYLGSSINSIVSKSGVMAEDEFTEFRRSQKERIMKSTSERKKRIADLATEGEISDDDMDKLLGLA